MNKLRPYLVEMHKPERRNPRIRMIINATDVRDAFHRVDRFTGVYDIVEVHISPSGYDVYNGPPCRQLNVEET